MILLTGGVLLWTLAHLFKRLLPGPRAAMGNAGKGLVTVASLAALAMMILGYRGAEITPVYDPLPGMGHLNNLLMLVALYLYGVGHARGRLSARIRHPMLTGTLVWSVAHLLVNGDLASIVLFGGIGLWAVLSMLAINRAEGAWVRPTDIRARGDVVNLVIAVVLYAVIAGIHIWLGYNPFLGTYG